MWVYTRDGFYSIVQHRDQPDVAVVRGRVEEDIRRFAERLVKYGVETDVWADESADYLWRFYAPLETVGRVLGELTEEIDYDNFKSAAPKDRGAVLMAVWDQTTKLEPDFGLRYYGIGEGV